MFVSFRSLTVFPDAISTMRIGTRSISPTKM